MIQGFRPPSFLLTKKKVEAASEVDGHNSYLPNSLLHMYLYSLVLYDGQEINVKTLREFSSRQQLDNAVPLIMGKTGG